MKKLFITLFAVAAFGFGSMASVATDAPATHTEYSIKDKKPKKKKKKKKSDASCEKTAAKSSCCSHAKSGCSKASSDK